MRALVFVCRLKCAYALRGLRTREKMLEIPAEECKKKNTGEGWGHSPIFRD